MAPDIYMSELQHQMVSSMDRDLWRSQPWTVSSVVGPVTTLLQSEQMGMGSGPGRARQSQRKMWSPSQLYTFSPKRNSGRRLLGRLSGTGWVGSFGDGGGGGNGDYRSEVTKSQRQPTRQKWPLGLSPDWALPSSLNPTTPSQAWAALEIRAPGASPAASPVGDKHGLCRS